ncbi:zinc-dependent alcohol dehydrogenase family protein [Marinococcus sp. PL1-022]|uniref:zinc-dependent alcohol dehydrogenase family protein n=1 Tax=Marinococcus sp. PL1-022 TaxID=3095363 RepID=UPI0029C44953|nr:zinc-dependent alcohol dehydrogenase family protein [Marinococcus sp. PL1-022]MDX6153862.1 zinc-dependent alcohol dehydrogenase family protein [Marinococcus sp. PL1-022]
MAPISMKAYVESFGMPFEQVGIRREEKKELRADEVEVRMRRSPVNPSDLIPIYGRYAHRVTLPLVPGYEGVGVIERIGPGISGALIGQRVLPLRGEGTWQSLVHAPAALAVPVPDSLSDETAAQMYINPVTAYILLTEKLKIPSGGMLVINAANSVMGRLLIQLASRMNIRVVGLVRRKEVIGELMQLGAEKIVTAGDGEEAFQLEDALQGKKADAAVDMVGGVSGTALARSVKPGKTLLALGLLSGRPLDWPYITETLGVKGAMFHLRHWNASISAARFQHVFQMLFHMVEGGELLVPCVRRTYPFGQVQQALWDYESEKFSGGGKILLGSP